MTPAFSMGLLPLCLLSACLPFGTGYIMTNMRSLPNELVRQALVRQITRETTPDGYLVKVLLHHLEGTQVPRVVLIRGLSGQRETLQVRHDGVVQFNVSATESGRYWVIFLLPRSWQYMLLNVSRHSPSLQVIPDMRLVVHGTDETIFSKGADVDLGVSATVHDDHGMNMDLKLHLRLDAMSASEQGKIVMYNSEQHSDFIQVVDSVRSEHHTYAHLHLNTSSGSAEGVFQAEAFGMIRCERECLLRLYAIFEDIPVYGEDRKGPFPEHYIGALSYFNTQTKFCSLHDQYPCFVRCELVGDHPSAVEILRVQPSGEITVTDYVSIADGGFRTIGQLTLLNATSADSGQYQCKSRSWSVEFVHTVRLIVGYDARIVTELSTVTVSEDGSVVATCFARGKPSPSIVMKDRHGVPVADVRPDVIRESVTQLNDTTSQAVVRITDPTLAADLQYLTCVAENVIQGQRFNATRMLFLGSNHGNMPSRVRYFLDNAHV